MSVITPENNAVHGFGFALENKIEPLAELDEIRQRVERLTQSLLDGAIPCENCQPASPRQTTEKSVREVIRARANRAKCFKANLFADPAWDILLELYASQLGGQDISVSSLCIAASVPATTALRWINVLEREKLIIRQDDPRDGRRSFVYLSPLGLAGMDTFFGSIAVHRISVGA